MPNGIEELLKKYGTSLAETRKLMPELVESIKRQREMMPPAMPSMPQFFTAEEVSGMGLVTEAGEPFGIEPGWRMKVTPPVDGEEPAISYITPEDWEITQDQIYISPAGERFTREQIEAQVVAPEVPLEVEQVFGRVFPEGDIEDLRASMVTEGMPEPERLVAEKAQEEFLQSIWEVGRTKDTEALLRQLGATTEQIEQLFAPAPPVPVIEEVPPSIPPQGVDYTVPSPSLPAGYGQPATVTIMPDWEYVAVVGGYPERRLVSDDFVIYYEDKEVGRVKADTGEFVMDDPGFWWKAWVPSLVDRLYLSQTGQVPPEAFSKTPLKVQQELSNWLYGPKKIMGGLSPADILSMVGLVGVGVIMAGTAFTTFNMVLQSKLGSMYRVIPGATLKGFPKPPAGVAETKAELQLYKAYQGTAVYRDWQALVQRANINPASFSYKAIDSRLFEAYRQFSMGNTVTAQNIVNQIRYGVGRFPGGVPTGKELVPYAPIITAPGGMPVSTPVVIPTATAVPYAQSLLPAISSATTGLPPAIAQTISSLADKVVTGVLSSAQITPDFLISQIPRLEKTPSLITQLKEIGYEEDAIAGMANEEAWANLFKEGAKIIETSDHLLMEIPPQEDIIKAALQSNWGKALAQEIGKLPAGKELIKLIDPRELISRDAATIESLVARGAIGFSEVVKMGQNAAAVKMGELQGITINPVKMFGFNKDAYSGKMVGRLLPDYVGTPEAGTLEHVFTHPEMYSWVGFDEGLEYVTTVHEINTQVFNLLKKEGVAPALSEEAMREWWIHRVVEGRYDADGELIAIRGRPGMKGRLAAKRGYEMHRKAPTMFEGMSWHIKYAENPEVSVRTYIEDAFIKIAQERFYQGTDEALEAIGKAGVKPSEVLKELYPDVIGRFELAAEELKGAANFHSVINRAIRGERVPEQTLRAIERRFPELGKRFRALVKAPVVAETQLRALLAQNDKIIKGLRSKLEKAEAIDIEAIKAEARTEAIRTGIPDEQKLIEAFRLMEYEDRLAFRSTMESQIDDIGKMLYEEQAELEGILEFLKTDPVAIYHGTIRGKKVPLTAVLKRGQLPETFSVAEAKMLMMGHTPKTVIKGRVPRSVVVDELADHFKMTEQELIDHIEYIAEQRVTAKDLRSLVTFGNTRLVGIKRMLEILDKVDTVPRYIPKAEPGMPEAGLQQDMFGYETPHFPAGKGKVTQISMDDYNKLVEYHKQQGLPPPDVGVKPVIEGIKGLEPEVPTVPEVIPRTIEEFRNWEFEVPRGGASKTPKTVFNWREDPEQMGETLADLAKQKDVFRFEEALGKGWEKDWRTSLHLADAIRRGEPITIYRSSDIEGIIPGAYVSESRQYAQKHGERILEGKFKLSQLEVFPDELMTYDDPHEFIYVPRSVELGYERYQKQIIPKPPAVEGQFKKVTYDIPPVKGVSERNAALDALRKEVKILTEARKAPYWKAKGEQAEKMGLVKQPPIGEGFIMQSHFSGKIYDQEFIDAVNAFFGHKSGLKVLKPIADLSGVLTTCKAALDVSFPAIQGLPAFGLAHAYLVSNPEIGARLMGAWFKSFLYPIRAYLQPEWMHRMLVKNEADALQRISFGGSSMSIDYFRALWAKGGLGGFAAKIMHKIPFSPYERAELVFYGAGEIIRNEFWKILKDNAIKQGSEFELAQRLDRMTGIISTEKMGITLTQRQLERSFLFFAPQYTRACLTFLGGVFRGGYTGAFTRRALGGLLAAGAIYYAALQYAMATMEGKDHDEAWDTVKEGFAIVEDPITGEVTWRPTGRLMSFKVGNYYFGFGGFWYGLVRLAGNINATIDEVGEREVIDLVRIIKNGSFNRRDNPFIYWWWTRASMVTHAIDELGTGTDFLGYPIETPWEYSRHLISMLEPIWMEQGVNWMIPGMARDNEIPEGAARQAVIPAELFGLRTFPESQWVKFYDKATEYIKHIPEEELDEKQIEAWREGKLEWSHLTDIQQMNLLSRYPELNELYTGAQADSAVRDSGKWKQWTGRTDEEKSVYYGRGSNLVDRLASGELDTREFREMWSDAGQNYGIALDTIEKEPNYSEIYDYFEKAQSERGEKYGFMDDLALGEYVEIMFTDYLDSKGDYDWDAKDIAVDEYIERWGEDTYERIRQMYADKKLLAGLSPVLIRLSDDKDQLGRAYWQLPYKPINEMDEDDDLEGNIPAEYFALWKQYQALETDAQRDAFIEANPLLAKDWRAEYRLNNPEDDARLALWGYGGKLQSMEAYDLVTKWGRELGIPLEQMGLGLPPRSLIGQYFEHSEIVKQTSGSSVEARLYKLEHPAWLDWGVENWGWGDLADDNINALRLRVQHKDLFAQYEGYGARHSELYIEDDKAREKARDKLLEENPLFRDDRRRVEAYQLEFPDDQIESFVEYSNLPVKGFEQERYLLEHPEFYQSMIDLKDIVPFDPDYKVPVVQYDEIYHKWEDLFEQYEAVTGTTSQRKAARERILTANPEFAFDRQCREAYGRFVPEHLVDTYAEWFTTKPQRSDDPWFEEHPAETYYGDDWWLMDRMEFYHTMVAMGLWEERDFSKVPTKAVFALYKTYRGIPKGSPQLNYRARFPELDAWGVLKFGWISIGQRGKKEEPKTPWEEAEEVKRFKELF